MKHDIDEALRGWEYKPGTVQARLIEAEDGREILQLRIDLGILQLETTNRPDGVRPHGCATYFEYLRRQALAAEQEGRPFTMDEEQCQEADREFIQFYHRRLCWLGLRRFSRAITDADHTLAFMDFVTDHSPGEEYTQDHEQYRGFVLYQRTQAAAALGIEKDSPEEAVDAIADGLKRMKDYFAAHNLEEQFEENGMVKQLHKMQHTLRQKHGIETTLKEQLDQAVAHEEYETAARIRDVMREREERKKTI